MFKKVLVALALSLAGFFFLATPVLAHGGGLNRCGCHFNRKTGECHCHRNRGCGCTCQPKRCTKRKTPAPAKRSQK